jgi:hypothetical protein
MAQDTKGVIRSRHCIVSPFLIYGIWLHLWYLVVIVLSVLFWFTASDYTFGVLCFLQLRATNFIFWFTALFFTTSTCPLPNIIYLYIMFGEVNMNYIRHKKKSLRIPKKHLERNLIVMSLLPYIFRL